MLNYMSVFGRDAEFTMDYGGGISKSKIRLMVSGNPIDPFNLTENASDEEQGLANILSISSHQAISALLPQAGSSLPEHWRDVSS